MKQELGKERLPHELPGMLVYREPDWRTPHALAVVNMLLPWMEPTADFPPDKCRALRTAIVPRLERIEMANVHTIMAMRSAVEVEVEVATANPERHGQSRLHHRPLAFSQRVRHRGGGHALAPARRG